MARNNCFRMHGFSLMELIVVVAVLAIVAAFALPGFAEVVRSNRLASASNELLTSISYARSEAIRNTRGAAICASTDGATCSEDGDWSEGWIIWADLNANGSIDADTETVLRFNQGNPRIEVDGQAGTVRFDPRGRLHASIGAPFTFDVALDECPAGRELVRAVRVSATGQARMTRENCP